MKCPNCQLDNPADTVFCGKCGARIRGHVPDSPEPDADSQNSKKPLAGIKDKISATRTLETTPDGLGRGELFARRFELVEELGAGGMGKVYRAYDKEIGEQIALKVLHPDIALDERTVDRFRNEIKLARKITHKNVCRMHELHQDGKQLFITMEYVPGQDLKGLIRQKGALTRGQSISIAKQVTEGLAEAHDLGVIHRDLKPQNIMVDKEGNAKIMDFGIARSLRTAGVTAEGMIIGTPEYMAPEQVEGAEADQRTDIYALGAIIFEMATGRVPFEGDSPLSVAYKHKNEPPIPPRQLNAQIPEPLNGLILRCLEKEKENRYQTADELLADLIRIEEGLPISERVILKVRPTIRITREKPKGIKRLKVAAIIVLALVIAAAFIYRLAIYKPAPPPAPKIPNSVAIISFENLTGDNEQDIWSRRGISERFITSLENTGYFQVITWVQMSDILKQMGKKDVKTIDSDLGFELCRQAGIESLVTGTLTKAGNIFALDIRVLDAETKKLRKSANSKGEGISSVINTQVDELSRAIAEGLGTAKEKIEQTQFRVAGVSTDSPEAYQYFIRGRQDAQKFEWESARRYLEKAVELDPEFAAAHRELMIVYQNTLSGDWKGALEKAKKFSAKATEKERLLIESSYAANIERNGEKRAEILKELIQKFPREKEPHYYLGLIYGNRGDVQNAIEEYNKALELDPSYGPALNSLGYLYLRTMHDSENALKVFDKYASVNPGDANPLDSLAECLFLGGKLDEAIEKYKNILQLKPDFYGSYPSLAYVLAFKEDYPLALAYLDQYLEKVKSPLDKWKGWLWKGFYSDWLGNLERASLCFRKAWEIGEEIGEIELQTIAHYLFGVMLSENGEYESAGDHLKIVFDSGSKEDGVKFLPVIQADDDFAVGLLEARRGHIESAEARQQGLNSFLDGHEHLREYFYGDAEFFRKRYQDMAHYLSASILLSKDSPDEAIAVCKKMSSPQFPPINFAHRVIACNQYFPKDIMARAYEKKEDLEKAIWEYERIVTLEPKNPDRRLINPRHYYRLAKLYEQKGNKGKARARYERFLELWKDADPGQPEVEDAKARLAAIS